MKTKFFLMLALIVWGVASMNAQVRIGDSDNPTQGAILDLNNTGGYKGGLLVPNVSLTTLTAVTDLTSPGDDADLKGLIVYNTNAGLLGGAGLFVWDGTKWNSVAFNPGDYSAPVPTGISIVMTGTSCFDVREALVATSPYTVLVTGAKSVDKITWAIEDTKGVLSGSPVTSTTTIGDDTETLPFNSFSDVLALANANGGTVTVKVTAYIDLTKSDNSTVKTAISKIISFKNKECCDGAILVNGAFDYAAGYPANNGSTAGDGAKAGGASGSNAVNWSPDLNMTSGATSSTALNTWFTAAGRDLCVYKRNYKSSGEKNGNATWANAVNNCANGTYADGDATAGWYLPNERELLYLYNALGGTTGSAIDFINLMSPNYVATTAEDMVNGYMWSSTEASNTQFAYHFYFNSSSRQGGEKALYGYIRCVRRI